MNILVLLKQTFDTEERIIIENGKVSEKEAKYIINPYDEFAVEEAVKIKESTGADVTIVTVGPPRVESAVRAALAMGADKAIIVEEDSFEGDEFTISKVLAAVVKRDSYDLILGDTWRLTMEQLKWDRA
ncbi:Acryloyl-CoA reductase electron transfer subunit gamma [Halalkalibacter krulwichiae]|uniref:Acryloyl-CoA reductase electron transfer subunit gamma n=1 Tax=Halalkalibacter krulwichiae TaxID=199441 RepID=A0A1X9MGK2_9BACI|nr:Acryloyl-CoA reductase electron transfer subunit gamma [Halalkalibacter krulwichiae]